MTFKLEVISPHIVEKVGEKKYVSYSVIIKSPSDVATVVLERRYTDFLELFQSLRRDNLPYMNDVTFPRKVILGNFDSSVISARRDSFEAFLTLISNNEKLRESAGFKNFLVGREEKEGFKLLKYGGYDLAKPKLLNVFSILNKIYTERHPAVIIALCRLAVCCNADPTPSARSEAEIYGDLALKRYEGISDVDLLRFYVPLLQMCAHIRWTMGRDKTLLEARIDDLKRKGHRVGGESLLNCLLAAEHQ